MACARFRRKDLNRYRKVYPYLRRKPKYTYQADKEVIMSADSITFTNAASGTYTFTVGLFPDVPIVTSISIDNLANSSANVNVFVNSVSTTSLEIKASAPFTGIVHFQAIYIAP